MFTTIESLDEYTKWKKNKLKFLKFFSEIKIFLIIFIFVSFVISVFTNRNMFYNWIIEILLWKQESKSDLYFLSKNENFSFWENTTHPSASQDLDKIQQIRTKQIEKILENKNIGTTDDFVVNVENNLKKKLNTYQVFFNTLPPTNRLIIPKLDQNIPVVVTQFEKPIEQINQWDFEKELYKWVVKYPSTAEPWFDWNTLIFGHTSYEQRHNNPYWSIFRNLPKLVIWDDIQIIRKWEILKYKIIEKKIISPKK